MTDLTQATAVELLDAYQRGETTALAVTDAYLKRISASSLGAFLSTRDQAARDCARTVDARRKEGKPLGALAGVPIAVKDNLATTFAPTTCASLILDGYTSPFDATVIEKLREADAIILGKTSLDEFAMGSSNEHSYFGPVGNPHDPTRTPGGSSGGSAAAVAGHLCCMALGSDTGGSVRQPAALCGCVGFKPTYGHVSRYGLVAFASSLDGVGPMARSVADCALLYDVISGPDARDSTAIRKELPSAAQALKQSPEPLKLGVIVESRRRGMDPEMAECFERTVELCRRLGHQVSEISIPHLELGIATYYVVANAEASANLARYDGGRYGLRADRPRDLAELYARTRGQGFGAEDKRRIMLGTYVLSAGYYESYYVRALQVRNLIRADFRQAFESVDYLISPTTPTPAFAVGAKRDDPLAMYLSDVFTVTANLAGIPAVSIPVALTQAGLPLGLQVWGARHDDHYLLRAAAILEQQIGYDPHGL